MSKKVFANHYNSKKERIQYFILWNFIILSWIGLVALAIYVIIISQWKGTLHATIPILAKVIICFNFLFITMLYCNNFKELVFGLYYNMFLGRKIIKEKEIKNQAYLKSNINLAKFIVYVVYCTKNDFDEMCIYKSMNQKYKNCKYFILDDSDQNEYIEKIDKFASNHNVTVIRRNSTRGYKAGNINNFLSKNKNYDYFVILDADEIIPTDFIGKALMYFIKDQEVGIVQAKNFCTRQNNWFSYIGSYVHNYQWQVEYNTRNHLGILNLCGHGAMISKECYEKNNGFPEILLEDWGMTFKALQQKYTTVYANNIVCFEKFPTDYISFKKRQSRWTRGGVECYKKIGWKTIFLKDIPFFRKLDICLSNTAFFVTILSVFVIILNLSVLFPIHFHFNYFPWYVCVTIFFAIVPLINSFIFYFRKINFFKLILVLIFLYLVYSSLLISSIFAIVSGIFKNKFNFFVTPKKKIEKISLWNAIFLNSYELILGLILTIAVILISHFIAGLNFFTFVWIIILIIPTYLSVGFTLVSNIQIGLKQKNTIFKESQLIYP